MENVYGINLIPENDVERVAALDRYQIFNSHRETAFDTICELACELFSCPISHISFLNADTEFVKAKVGIGDLKEVNRNVSFCAVAILTPELLLVEDTYTHHLFANHPYVTDHLRIRFYAGAPIITPDGFIIGTICVIDTKPRKMPEKDQKLLQKLAQIAMEQTELRYNNLSLLEQRDEFIAIASHEMRTPLTALKAAIQVLNYRKEENLVKNRMIDQAKRSVDKLSYLVNDLFDASRLAVKKFELKKARFNLSPLIIHCCEFINNSKKNQVVVTGNTQLEIDADEQKVEQVLINLLENAIKYAPNSLIIELEVKTMPGIVHISISDKGPGISPDKLPHVFRRYFRSQADVVQTGLGLGLYICAEIIKQHGGEIGVNSVLGEGCTFWFTLPLIA